MVEYFLQNYDGKFVQHFLEMRKNYSSKDEKKIFKNTRTIKFNSPILKTGTNDIPQFIKKY